MSALSITLKAVAALSATVTLVACGNAEPQTPPPLYDSAVVGGFDLVDSAGNQVTDADFEGQYQMVYFGYAYCPDVCPFDVARMVQGYEQFAQANPDLAEDIQPIFITVDPERDTPDVIAEFTANFSDDLIGLTGSPEAIEQAAENYFAYYTKMEPNAEGGYLMDHSRSGYLVDREGQPMALLPVEQSAEAVAAELEKWVR
ncbi:SCO family protein [Erythrobacter sp. JGD-13]|uniref:SCO family protein n=1 Tax=Aurantiacibacter sediminis TaxID=2793064 RepID=A0ABS0N1F1_9SPHN|nr:SCO family protein [Aurantiacibacter sediminis]